MKKLLYLILPLLVIFTFHETNDVVYQWPYIMQPVNPEEAYVVKNVDGDTIKVRINGTEETIRMIGLDTPETVHPSKPVEFYGKEASNFTKALCPTGSTVYLTYDWDPRDKYGRLLAYVWYKRDDQWILHNLNLIVNGYGHAYTVFAFDEEYMSLFVKAEQHARENGYGLWRDYDSLYRESEEPVSSQQEEQKNKTEDRKTSALVMSEAKGDLEIAYVQYEGALEFVELVNNGNEAIPLEGYQLISDKGNDIYFFSSKNIAPGEIIKVFSGPDATENLWSNNFIHNNDGDGVILQNDQSDMIAFYYW